MKFPAALFTLLPLSPSLLLSLSLVLPLSAAAATSAAKPNIVYILCDDLGYGDVRAFNAQGKIATPQMDRLAQEGVMFTDAHSSSSVCTPTRYGVLTGRYNWRSRLQNSVLGGLSPRLIEPGRVTVASLLKEHGYFTACIGKWHLGMDWAKHPGKTISTLGIESPEQVTSVDYTQPIANGPNSVGFDYFFGIAASLDMVPYTFIENDRVAALPDVPDMKFPMTAGRTGGFTRTGPGAKDFAAVDVLPTLTKKTVELIGTRAADAKQGRPFFLYVPLNSPHTPINPSPAWVGKSGLSPYADFVMETDWAIGEIMRALAAASLEKDTLLIVTSDNGCSPQANFPELLPLGHNPNHTFRGHKADIYEGGHRVPFIARWTGVTKPGTRYTPYVCLTDLMATAADILAVKLPAHAGEDSVSLLPALRGGTVPVRDTIVHHSITGAFSIRQGNWKLELCPGSGGWSAPTPGQEPTGAPRIQLYDLAADLGETKNVQAEHPAIVARLTDLLKQHVANGRSTPGARQGNTVEPDIMRGTAVTAPKKGKRATPVAP
jgi:arylsulfatase A-like enzyme